MGKKKEEGKKRKYIVGLGAAVQMLFLQNNTGTDSHDNGRVCLLLHAFAEERVSGFSGGND